MWGLVLLGLCLLAATGARPGDRHIVTAGAAPATMGMLAAAADAAVLPPKVADEVRGTLQAPPLRSLALAAVLAVLIGVPALLRLTSSAAGHHHEPLRARRHTIALRAPPLRLA